MDAPDACIMETVSRLEGWTESWHGTLPAEDVMARTGSLAGLIERNHRANFALWHEEDRARSPDASDAEIAAVKRRIDQLNQRRNDLVERLDAALLADLPEASPEAPQHTETPGMILDRLSILTLKVFHMREQAHRTEVSESQRRRSRERLSVLLEQRTDLLSGLRRLLDCLLARSARFKVYQQMKMYNDPDLNPEVYRRRPG